MDVASDIKQEISAEALRIVTGARRAAYGKPEDNFARIALLWNAHLVNVGIVDTIEAGLMPRDVAAFMRLMKEARLAETPDHRDSFVDLVGYALCGAEVAGVALIEPEAPVGVAPPWPEGPYVSPLRERLARDAQAEGVDADTLGEGEEWGLAQSPHFTDEQTAALSTAIAEHKAARKAALADKIEADRKELRGALQIEAGKFYRTRDGRKVGPAVALADDIDDEFPWYCAPQNYDRRGVSWHGGSSDIVAEWSDEATS